MHDIVIRGATFYGREKENLIYPIALANLILHGIDNPSVWHGNTLTGAEVYGGLFQDAPALYDLVLTNPPFGGKEGRAAQTHFAYKTGSTQVLFLQHVIDSLKPGGDAPWSSMKEFYSARAKVPLFRQSGSCSTNVIFGAL